MIYTKAYMLLVHDCPNQIKNLVNKLDDGNSVFFIHVDKSVDLESFKIDSDNVIYIKKRVACNWGGFSLVSATAELMKQVNLFFRDKPLINYHAILLSGSHWPLKSNHELQNFFKSKIDLSFFSYWQLPYSNWWDGGMFRVNKVYFFNVIKFKILNKYINKILNKLNVQFLYPISIFNKSFKNHSIYGSQQWFALSKTTLDLVIKNTRLMIDLRKCLKFSFAPDELYFITLIKILQQKNDFTISNNKLTYTNFNGSNQSPELLNLKDIENLIVSSDFLFARKLNPDIDYSRI